MVMATVRMNLLLCYAGDPCGDSGVGDFLTAILVVNLVSAFVVVMVILLLIMVAI